MKMQRDSEKPVVSSEVRCLCAQLELFGGSAENTECIASGLSRLSLFWLKKPRTSPTYSFPIG